MTAVYDVLNTHPNRPNYSPASPPMEWRAGDYNEKIVRLMYANWYVRVGIRVFTETINYRVVVNRVFINFFIWSEENIEWEPTMT